MSRFSKPHKVETPSLYCGECHTWVPQNLGMVKKVGPRYWVCDDCASRAPVEAP